MFGLTRCASGHQPVLTLSAVALFMIFIQANSSALFGGGGTPVMSSIAHWQSTTMTFTPGAATNNLLTSFGTDMSSSVHPDFSATGAPMIFGFAAIDYSNASSFTAVSGYDNWSIGVITNGSVPEPGSVGVLVLTSLAMLRRPRRVT